ncbi:hypothetical protein EJ06DRAFT_527907 [Trichodelitschia bisporula]|uniref:Uncharacterized protein n=1 Tax=Trichodelitschia bisporula TaxID=703511 RepID=A0A6G1I420_9PEZI|nr:hypothetical protein EJ06DRAFT_527907 [Trichodelitschia bisporula]
MNASGGLSFSLCRSNGPLLRCLNSSTPRAFSSSARCLKRRTLPTFRPSSNPELETLLTTIRSKVFIPGYLNDTQRKRIQRQKYKSQLENEAIYATIGNEEVRLEHLDVLTDIPPANSFLRALHLSSSPDDWANFPALLEGFHTARNKSEGTLRPSWLALFVTRAATAGAISTVIRCLREAGRNGMSLAERQVREPVFREIRNAARREAWSPDATAKALSRVREVLKYMDLPAHQAGRDPRAEPLVVGTALELTARMAKTGGEDEETLVVMVKRMLPVLERQLKALNDDEAWAVAEDMKPAAAAYDLNKKVSNWIPVYFGLKIAEEGLGERMGKGLHEQLRTLLPVVEGRLDRAAAKIEELVESTQGEGFAALQEWRSR